MRNNSRFGKRRWWWIFLSIGNISINGGAVASRHSSGTWIEPAHRRKKIAISSGLRQNLINARAYAASARPRNNGDFLNGYKSSRQSDFFAVELFQWSNIWIIKFAISRAFRGGEWSNMEPINFLAKSNNQWRLEDSIFLEWMIALV